MTADARNEALFVELVLVFQQSAWVALGKIQNPETGRAEADLKAAAHAIDMLAMLKAKTSPTLSEPERSLLDNALTQLRLNYVEAAAEVAAGQGGSKSSDTPATESSSGASDGG
jgi:hypothetical protein